MKIAILDGYIDEPACLGVPPYIAPQIRYLAGAINNSGSDYFYLTIDEYRKKPNLREMLNKCNILVVIAGAVVPGKYLGGSPISYREALEVANEFHGITILGGSAGKYGFVDTKTGEAKKIGHEQYRHLCSGDIDACFYDFINQGEFSDRMRTLMEQNTWSLSGAEVVKKHQNYPKMLVAEIETFRGCTRYQSGGCSFCIEPEFGEPLFRDQADIIAEVKSLKNAGVSNYRLGAQSCIYSYKSKDVGTHSAPQPVPEELEQLLSGIRQAIGRKGLLHVDNANPAILSDYPVLSRKITKCIVENCTSGNVVAFGMESADTDVIRSNNLNSMPEQVMDAIELVNELGRKRGYTGLPALLPGLNFIAGLKGESKDTFKMNLDFLKDVKARGFLLRRINIRQVSETRRNFKQKKFHKEFKNFKRQVRENIDRPMLTNITPEGTIMKDVFIEAHEGNISFGRQLGSYPLLVGIPYKIQTGTKIYAYIFDHGFRSITGCEYPFPINNAPMSQVKTLPGLGARRAARLVKARPFKTPSDLISALDDEKVAENLLKFVKLGKMKRHSK